MKPLTERHHEAAAVLATGTTAEAAEAVGVTVRTIHDWKKRDDFAALVRELRGREASHEPGALATMRELLGPTCPDGSPRSEEIRLRAALGLVRAGRGGTDPAENDAEAEAAAAAAGLVILDPSILEDEPLDLKALYEGWDNSISGVEADYWRNKLDRGWAGIDADALREMVEA